MNKSNIFEKIPKQLKEEFFEDLISKDGLKIERIVSYGHTTAESEWYDQDSYEWVILLKGEAIVSFFNEDDVRLKAGDYLNIPAHKKHRVSWTKPNQESVWLAVHY
ncbi:cupin domain-containing protein [Candidatus Sulfurimonas marisnigri]|uniref:Cupin domain-containing protein n=1 Tax=Candidatus Sulfurimonas marisnigri TaxID=2740405 RepID=A0A7S7LZQ0_9BACT|nr:cupin domain-containing protein [Candidatus Sulfurimonas marisnigri]QOY54391.1 cupin domain-containing protein [Candidatus Sulfurimonas marisnigri]